MGATSAARLPVSYDQGGALPYVVASPDVTGLECNENRGLGGLRPFRAFGCGLGGPDDLETVVKCAKDHEARGHDPALNVRLT